jgi:hypothetical protein
MGAVEVSREGGFLHKSEFGGAARVKDPIYSGTASFGTLSGVKEVLAGGMVLSVARADGRGTVLGDRRQGCCCCFEASRPDRVHVTKYP